MGTGRWPKTSEAKGGSVHADEHGDQRDSEADGLDPEIRARLEAPLTEDDIRIRNWVTRQKTTGPRLMSEDRLAALRDMDDWRLDGPEARRKPGE
jgi:hypothetical protein